MKPTKAQRIAFFYQVMQSIGFSPDQTASLLRAEKSLHRWAERDCNGDIERDEESGKPFAVYGINRNVRSPIPDREKGALKRIADIVGSVAGLSFYHQGDPRGCALYILRPSDHIAGATPDCYYSRGIAVCID